MTGRRRAGPFAPPGAHVSGEIHIRCLALAAAIAAVLLTAAAPADAAIQRLDFDDRAQGEVLTDEYAGIEFPFGVSVVDPGAPTSSPPNAVSSRVEPTEELNTQGMRIAFADPQMRVAVRAGFGGTVDQTTTATLRAFDANGQVIATSPVTTVRPAVTTVITVRRPGNEIRAVELLYDNAFVEMVDDLELEALGPAPPPPPPPPPPGVKPFVELVSPAETGTTNLDVFTLQADIFSNTPLRRATLEIVPENGPSRGPFTIGTSCGSTDCIHRRIGPTVTGPLSPGVNTVIVRAEARDGAVGLDSARVTSRPPPADLNLFATGLEVTQATQTYVVTRDERRGEPTPGVFDPFDPRTYRGVPLVERKPTVVRLYGGANTPEDVENVPARLYGTRDGRLLPGAPLRPVQGSGTAVGGRIPQGRADQRSGRPRGWNFVLPPEWTRGTVHLRAELNPRGGGIRECPECHDAANDFADVKVTFRPTGVIGVKPVRVVYTRTDPDQEPIPVGSSLVDDLRRIYPMAPEDAIVLPEYLATLRTGTRDCGDILGDLGHASVDLSVFGPRERLKKATTYGVMSSLVDWTCGGRANRPGARAIGIPEPFVAPHEIGHNFGLRHAGSEHDECRDGQACERDWPYLHGGIGEIGYDVRNLSTINPGTVTRDQRVDPPRITESFSRPHDFMSYGENEWISPRNYVRLFNALRLDGPSESVPDKGRPVRRPRRVLLVSGVVTPDGRARLRPLVATRSTETDDQGRTGPFRLEVLDAAGRVLTRRPFAPDDSDDDPAGGRSFFLVVRDLPAAAQVRLVRASDERVLVARRRSAHAPVVRWATERRALRRTGPVTLRWRASDADGDPLEATLQFSRDGGRSWTTVARGIEDDAVEVEQAELPGTRRGRWRVLASDGFRTTAARSRRTFTVPDKPPRPLIHTPGPETVVLAGADLTLSGAAGDLEEGRLLGRRLVWRSSRDGRIGTGPGAVLRAPSVGLHRISLTATDPRGGRRTATTLVRVEPSRPASRTISRSPDLRRPRLTRVGRRVRAARPVLGVRFSEPVVGAGRRSVTLRAVGGGAVPARVERSRDGRGATLRPLRRLTAGRRYRLTVGRNLTDLAGRAVVPRSRIVTAR